jgi:hypothetical protein
MRKPAMYLFKVLILVIFVSLISFPGCRKSENPIKFPKGTFPDSTFTLSNINSSYDDYNVSLSEYSLSGNIIMVFSSNRNSSGGQFDLVQGALNFSFDQTNGKFCLGDETTNNSFLSKLTAKANTAGNDFGPYRLFSSIDGYEYMILSSVNTSGDLDFYYLRNTPVFGNSLPDVLGPYPANLLNTGSDDAYISFDSNQDSCYFSSASGGNFDIFVKGKSPEKEISTWLEGAYSPSARVDSVNSSSNDKCPFIYRNIMVFASDRPGGLGGFDLYYSVFGKGKWSSPVNFGPSINTSSDEYRPVIGSHRDFKNNFMIYSSNRPGGKGGFDLYLRGFDIP